VSRTVLLAVALIAPGAGCTAVIEPGHRALLFDPQRGGLQREVLSPGSHRVGLSGRLEDFDVTYSTRAEPLQAITREGLPIRVKMSVIYRPIVAELYPLAAEIGHGYYDEVVGPEVRSAALACLATHSYADLPTLGARLEDEVESEGRRRIAGKHVELAAVTFESIELPPELVAAIREREIAEQSARRRKADQESNALREKLESDRAWEREKLELERNVERRRLQRAAEGH